MVISFLLVLTFCTPNAFTACTPGSERITNIPSFIDCETTAKTMIMRRQLHRASHVCVPQVL